MPVLPALCFGTLGLLLLKQLPNCCIDLFAYLFFKCTSSLRDLSSSKSENCLLINKLSVFKKWMTKSISQSKDYKDPNMNQNGHYGHYWNFAEGLVESHKGN